MTTASGLLEINWRRHGPSCPDRAIPRQATVANIGSRETPLLGVDHSTSVCQVMTEESVRIGNVQLPPFP
jgi:hypothetical protein